MTVPKTVHPTKPKTLPKSLGFSRYALDFDGVDDKVSIPSSSSLEGMAELTVSVWLYPKSFGSYNVPSTYGTQGGYAGKPFELFSNYAGDHKARIYLGDGTNNYFLVANTPLETGKWYHIVFTYDGTYIKAYLNGSLDDSKNVGNFTLTTTTDNFYIGNGASDKFPFHGLIDNFQVYERTLSPSEIKLLTLDYHSPPMKNLSGWWRMEEGTGLTAHDRSGNGNDGTLNPSNDPPTWRDVKKWELRSEAGL